MSRRYRGQRGRFLSSSGFGVESDGGVVYSPAAASNAAAALCVGYMYPQATYLKFCPEGIQYPRCPLDSTVGAAEEAEATAASASSDIEKKFRSHSDKRCEGEGEGTRFSFFPLSLAKMMRSLLVKYSSVGNFHGTRDI